MVETSTWKVPPVAPVDVPVGARASVVAHQGRNTSTAEIGKPLSND